MYRNPSALAEDRFEAVIIGGGIHGATIFYQLAAAGMKVALIEQDDFGGGTSANSLKILHGGLRYLQHLNIKRMRESINSRKYFMQMAPHLIQPMPCVIPTSGLGMKGKPVMGIAMLLFDLISWDRNSNCPPQNRVGRGRLLSTSQCRKIGAGLGRDGETGGALWYDDLISHTERMALSFVKAGVLCGGVAANYVRGRKLTRNGNHITGVEVTDRLSGQTFVIDSGLVINAAGPWIDEIRKESHQLQATEELAKAVNIVIDKPLFNGHGVGLEGTEEFTDKDAKLKRSKRFFFFVPWKKRTIIGTTYSYYDGKCGDLQVSRDDIQDILDEVNTIYPEASLTLDNVVFSHAGLMPAYKVDGDRSGTPQLVKHSRVIDHGEVEQLAGLLTIEGVKYTTAPAIAVEVEKLLRKKNLISQPENRRVTFSTDLTTLQNSSPEMAKKYPHIVANYGSDSKEIFRIIGEEAGAGNYLTTDLPLIKAEVLYCVRKEMAVKLSDVVLRRTECGNGGCPGEERLYDIAAVMAPELGWDDDIIKKEVDQVLSIYRNTLNIPL